MHKKLSVLSTTLLLLALHAAAGAASSDAWSAHHQEVASKCIEASGLRDARAAGEPIDFDDSVGYTALLVQGRYPQPHMKNRRGRVLCLFDKRSRVPAVAPADDLMKRR